GRPPRGPVGTTATVDRRNPVTDHALVARLLLAVAPDHFIAAWLHLEQGAPHAVALADEHLVADDHRVAGVDALQVLGPPGEVEIDLAAFRLEADQAAAGQDEAPAPPVDRRQDGAGVTRQLVGCLVGDLAGALGEGHDAAD